MQSANMTFQQPESHPQPGSPIGAADRLHEQAHQAYLEGDSAQAQLLFFQLLALRISQLGERHPRTIESMHDIGTVALGMGRWQLAFDFLSPAQRLAEEVFGPRHPRTRAIANQLALLRRLRCSASSWRGWVG